MQSAPNLPNLFAPRGETPYPTARATQEMVAQTGWAPWEDRTIRDLTEPERRAGKKMSWVRVCEHLPHRSAQECRARARRLWLHDQGGAVAKPPVKHPYDLGTAAAEAVVMAMEALGHKRVDTYAQRVTVDLDPFVLWRAPSHEDLLDEHGELMRCDTPEPSEPAEVDAYSEDALCVW